jgi:hypothetical protein
MFVRHVALVSEVASIDASGLARVSSAIQRQVVQDLAPIWEVSATVDPFPALEDVPAGYWPIIITAAGLPHDLLGVHVDEHGQPMAWVEWSDSWSLTASHECMEMLVDPWGNQLRAAHAFDGRDEQVEYLLEVCDPCQDPTFSYTINDTLVSDFYTPSYFDPVAQIGTRYSKTGAIERPLQVLKGGYLSFRDLTTNEWSQVDGDGKVLNLGQMQLGVGTGSLREGIDARSPGHLAGTKLSATQVQARVGARHSRAKVAARLRASAIRARLCRHG